MPQYKKVFDIGTYTGNGGQYRVGIPTLRPPGPTGTQIAQSLRFRSANSNYLNRTPGSTTSRTTWTWSGWVKRGALGTASNLMSAIGSSRVTYIVFPSTDKLTIYSATSAGGGDGGEYISTQVFKDTSIWYHIVVAYDSTQATAANRIKAWVNGSQITSWGTSTAPTLNHDSQFNWTGAPMQIGSYNASQFFDGYLSEVNFIDGQQLTPSSFGEYNSDGIWVPKTYSSTYGTNGFYLKFASGAVGTDSSGNGNTWTLNGFNVTTSNTTYDIMTDSPTDYLSGSMTTANNAGNYCTMNPRDVGTTYIPTFSNGNLKTVHPNNTQNPTRGTLSFTSGKWYFEATLSSFQYNPIVGVMTARSTLGTGDNYQSSFGTQSAAWGGYGTGRLWSNGSVSTISNTFTTNDVIMIAFDVDNGKFYMGKNGTWIGSANPSGGTGNNATFDHTDPITPFTDGTNNDTWILNFGQRAFTYTVPTGFVGVNTYNITRPADSSLWFYGDTPDLMWIKNRSTTGLHTITDTVRGIGLNLVTSSSAAETSYPAVTEMNKFGMSVINDGTSIVNGSGNSMVYWGWKAGSNTSSTSVTNNDGAVTSQVSVNKLSGFSIVTGTTVSTGGSTFGHGLGVTPDLMIVKIRSAGSTDWYVYHSSLGYLKYLLLNSTAAVTTEVTPTTWGTSPTSSAFTLGGNWQGGYNIVAYLWDAIPGYSAFGTYTGNGSADGPFVYLGFRPRWIMIKVTSAIDHWILYDTVRSDYNPADDRLFANLTNAESASDNIDILSNGFKLRSSTTVNNTSSGTYIYAAFAEIPFKFSRAR